MYRTNATAQATPLSETQDCTECGGTAGLWEDDRNTGYQCYEPGCDWTSVDGEIE